MKPLKAMAPLLTVLLAGCASAPAPVTQRVEVPVPFSCVKAGDVPKRPDFDVEKLAPTASDGEKVLALASDWPRGRKYEGELEAIIAGCLVIQHSRKSL